MRERVIVKRYERENSRIKYKRRIIYIALRLIAHTYTEHADTPYNEPNKKKNLTI